MSEENGHVAHTATLPRLLGQDVNAEQLLAAALELAREGFRVFPCHTPVADVCSCGTDCTSPGKHPRTAHGCKDATTDPAAITEWWTQWPTANVGVATGRGLLVVDVDGADAQAALAGLAAEHGRLPATRAVRTGRDGGRHLWFRTADEVELPNSSGRLARGIDTRGAGGYVLAPPSAHPSGRPYSWEDPAAGLAVAPSWLHELLVAPPRRPPAEQHPTALDSRRLFALGEAVLPRELDALAAHPKDPGTGRGTALYGASARLGRIIAAGGLGLASTWQALAAAGESLGLSEAEIERSVDRGLAEGMAQPLELGDRPWAAGSAHGPARPSERHDHTQLDTEDQRPARKPSDDRAPHADEWRLLPSPNPPAFPIDALPEEVARFVTALSLQFQTAPDLAALAVLGVLSAVAMPTKVDCGNWEEEALALYILAVSPSGDRKSTIMKKVAAPLYRLADEAREDAREQRREHEARRDMLKARKDELVRRSGKLDDEEEWGTAQVELEKVSDELAQAAEFVEPRFLTDDATPEGLAELLAKHEKIAVLSAESAVIDNLLGHYSDKGKANLHVVCKAVNGERAYVDRRGTTALILPRPLLGITLFAQPQVLEKVLGHGVARGQGLIARFVLVDASAASYVGHRQINPPPSKVPPALHEAWDRVVQRVNAACAATKPTQPGFVGSVASEEERFLTLSLSSSSKKLLTELEEEVEPRQADGGDLATVRDWISRHHGRIVRVAASLHLAEFSPEQPISEETMRRAMRIGRYILEHGLLSLTAPDELLRRTLLWLSRQKGNEVSQRDIHTGPLGGHGKAERAAALAEALVDVGALRPILALDEEPNPSGGRPRGPRFEINPVLRKSAR